MNVVVVGYGAMGEKLVERIGQTKGLSLVGVIDGYKNFGLNTFEELTVVPDVIVDFSHPSNLSAMLNYAVSQQVGLIIATTGYSQEEESAIIEASNVIPIIYTSNTSLGITVIKEVLKSITPALEGFDIEIIEKHHNQKLDAPSGTAKMLLNEIVDAKDQVDIVYGREGNNKRLVNEIGVHAVRGGTIAGEHSVIFAGLDEIIEIKHTALSKSVFVTGVLAAVQFLLGKKAGLYTMKDVLFKKE